MFAEVGRRVRILRCMRIEDVVVRVVEGGATPAGGSMAP